MLLVHLQNCLFSYSAHAILEIVHIVLAYAVHPSTNTFLRDVSFCTVNYFGTVAKKKITGKCFFLSVSDSAGVGRRLLMHVLR